VTTWSLTADVIVTAVDPMIPSRPKPARRLADDLKTV